jgi:integrase/recombinase XerD
MDVVRAGDGAESVRGVGERKDGSGPNGRDAGSEEIEGVAPNLRMSDAVARFLEHCRIGKRLSPHTVRAYHSDLTDFRKAVGQTVGIGDVDRDLIRFYARSLLENRRLKETTARRRIATLKVLFRWLEREELIALSVFHRLDLSIRLPKRLPRALESADMRRLLRAAEAAAAQFDADVRTAAPAAPDGRYVALIMLFVIVVLFTTGLRVSELVSVRLDNVSHRDGHIRVSGKGNRERTVYLPGRPAMRVLMDFLDARRKIRTPSDALLVAPEGTPLTAQYIRRRLRDLAQSAGIGRRVTPHMLRHTAATQLLEAGVDIRFVQRLLGHASIATTQIYTQVRDATLKAKLARADTLSRLGLRRADN